ncbi:MAG TPA: Hsp20/alpha crystallin family protein [Candidatus Paceibacterota bacterium]|nr:Hsp20/alpha crystallin family protein [Candidatus Paceibacterota bacterium]HMP18849.1 Hsp20/alpha crystallin family protein [Candidatus Paceibacterota bacterium]
MKKKRTLFERLTGTAKIDDLEDDFQDEIDSFDEDSISEENEKDTESNSGQLAIDVVNRQNEIIIKTMIAGVKPQDLDIQITRDMVTINGHREEDLEIDEQDYYHRELFWGSFSRNIILPEEIDVDLAEAKEKHGLLEIKLPKLDKNRKTKLNVRSN